MITAVYRGFSGGPGRVSALIKRLDRVEFKGEKLPPVINHIYRRFEFDDRPSLITESHYKGGVQITPHSHLLKAVDSGKVDHCYETKIAVTPEQAMELWNRHEHLHGDGYDLGLIVSYYTWIRFQHRSNSRQFEANKKNNKWTCNEHYVSTGAGIENDIPRADLSMTPEKMFLLTYGHPSALHAEIYGRIELAK